MPADPQKLLNAAGRGNGTAVRALIADGMPIDVSNGVGYTALMSAARSYRIEIVDWLLSQGADPNAVTHDGHTVLHSAVGETPSQPERQAACVLALLKAGADPNIQTPTGHTPLMQAAWFGCKDSVEVLLAYNADLTLTDHEGRHAAQVAADRGHTEVQRLIEA